MSNRDPFPFPKPENDNTFTGTRPLQKETFDKPTHMAQWEEPWSRLYVTATSSSSRRSVTHNDDDRAVPNDSLDIHLKSNYDHHTDFLCTRNQTLYQREVSENHRRLQKREKREVSQNRLQNDSTKMWIDPQKISVYRNQGAIESPHNASTNGGFSRKHDGGFYCT